MKILTPGHRYELSHLDGDETSHLQFVQRAKHNTKLPNKEGTTNQEVIRVLIDRVRFLDGQMPWDGNQEIINHLRMALALHEARAMMRKVEKGELAPEHVITKEDGHFWLVEAES